jgi:hypothetical protein
MKNRGSPGTVGLVGDDDVPQAAMIGTASVHHLIRTCHL